MSAANYRRMESIGVTGKNTDTCLVACVDILSPDYDITAPAYRNYAKLNAKIEAESIKKPSTLNRMLVEPLDKIARDIGLDGHKDFRFERADTTRELGMILRKCFLQSVPVILEVDLINSPYGQSCEYDGLHAVGVIPIAVRPEAFRVRSTWLPPELKGVMTVDDLFPYLTHHGEKPIKKYVFNDANIMCLPGACDY